MVTTEPGLAVRWSALEARKPYARPLGVTFLDAAAEPLGMIATAGDDLLYYRQFQAATLRLAGEVFRHPTVEAAPDHQRAWLDVLTPLLPAAPAFRLAPVSAFADHEGRAFRYHLEGDGWGWSEIEAAALIEYQELQAVIVHQTGHLFRHEGVEALADPAERQQLWMAELASLLRRPDPDDALASSWPWA